MSYVEAREASKANKCTECVLSQISLEITDKYKSNNNESSHIKMGTDIHGCHMAKLLEKKRTASQK